MSKMITGILIMYIILTFFAAVMNGGGGMNTTTLTSAISSTDTTIHVTSTSGFLTADYLIIGGEKLTYSGKTATTFTGCDRGSGEAHAAGSKAYSQEVSVINGMLNYNIGAVTSSAGPFSVILIPAKFFTTALPNIISNGMPFTGPLVIFGFIWYAITAGIVISLAIALVWAASGIIGRIT